MIICRTPFRISFFGGGTDYPGWYRAARRRRPGHHHRQVLLPHLPLPAAVLRAPHPHRLPQDREPARTVDEISHPAVREALRYLRFDRGLELHHDGDLPARSGMGSSSAFTVGLLHALHALRGEMRTQDAAGPRKHPHRTGRAAGDGRLAGPGDGGLRRPAARPVPARRRDHVPTRCLCPARAGGTASRT